MKTELLQIGSVEIEVTFKPIKNLHLSVHPPYGHVTISSPEIYDLEKVKIYAATKLAWIKKEQKKFREQEREEPRDFRTQESHYFLGTRYLLKLIPAKRNKVELKGKKLNLYTADPDNKELNRKTLYSFYRKELRKKIEDYTAQYSQSMDLDFPEFKIRTMKTKWGSCSTNSKRLWFNIELAKKPLECIEYIVVHEMVHLTERNHNKRFVLLMDQYYPNWQVQKKVLNELPIV